MKAIVIKKPGLISYEEVSLRSPKTNEVVIEVKASGICSTDLKKIFEGKSYFYPIILGHEFSGIVSKIGNKVKNIKVNDRVVVAPLIPCYECSSCEEGRYSICENYSYIGSRTSGGYAEYVIAPEANIVKISENLDFEIAAFAEPTAVSLHGLLKVLNVGDKVLILGAGTIGLISAQIAQLIGSYKVCIADIEMGRLEIGKKIGLDIVHLEADSEKILNDLRSINFDVVVEATGNIIGLENSLRIVKKSGRVLSISLYKQNVKLSYEILNRIIREEILIIGSWNSYSQPFPGKEWYMTKKFMEKRLLNLKPLISHRFKLEEAEQALKKIYYKEGKKLIKAMFLVN